MNWYFSSFSKEKFDAFRNEKDRSRKLLTVFFNEKEDDYSFDSITTLVDHLIEKGLTYDGYPTEKAGDVESAMKLFTETDSIIGDLCVQELFDIETETHDPVMTAFYEYFNDDELPHILRKAGYWEAIVLTPNEIKWCREVFHPLLQRLETELNQWENSKPLRKCSPKVGFLKFLFSKTQAPDKDEETVKWEEKKEWFEWKMDCLKTGFLPAFDSIWAKNKYCIMTWE